MTAIAVFSVHESIFGTVVSEQTRMRADSIMRSSYSSLHSWHETPHSGNNGSLAIEGEIRPNNWPLIFVWFCD